MSRQGALSTKMKIAKEAEKLFAQKGYAATSMEEITAASGSSKGSIYYHFKSKEKLFLFIVELNANQWKEDWQLIESGCHSVKEKLYKLADHYLDDFQNPLMKASEEFGGSQTADPEVFEQILTIFRSQYYETYEKIIQEGIQTGEWAGGNSRDLMYILFGMHGGLGVAYFDEITMEDMKRLYRKSIDIFLYGVTNKSNS